MAFLTQETERAVQLAAAAGDEDPATGLAAVAALRSLVEILEELHVERARAQGWSWQAIAERLGVSRQAVHQKHAAGGLFRRRR